MRSIAFYTLGCRVNQYESEALAECFEKKGWTVYRNGGKYCTAAVINTCTVTTESDRKSRQTIRRAIRENPDGIIAVVGCFSQISPEDAAGIPGVDIVLGNGEKLSVTEKIEELSETGKVPLPFVNTGGLNIGYCEKMSVTSSERTRAYIKIEDGCENKCAYCIIPRARGKIRSKPLSDIISECSELKKAGYHEVVLTGIEVAGYGRDLNGRTTLADVIEEIDGKVGFDRISLGSLEPSLMRPDFVDRIAGLPSLSHHFHLSLQSGCDRTLNAMKRKYNTATVRENVYHIRELLPDCQFTADVIVGFPGESEEDFEATCEFIRSLSLYHAHVFSYSRRPGTVADRMTCQIPESIKAARSEKLISICEREKCGIVRHFAERGGIFPVLFEECGKPYAVGRLNNYIEVRVDSSEELQGKIRNVRITGHDASILVGELI